VKRDFLNKLEIILNLFGFLRKWETKELASEKIFHQKLLYYLEVKIPENQLVDCSKGIRN